MQLQLRKHIRTNLACQIKVTHPDLPEILATTEDLSDAGVYIKHEELTRLKIGDIIYGQVQGLGDDLQAPVLTMEVVRITSSGVGCRFIQEDLA